MVNPDDTNIPEEILRAEKMRATSQLPGGPNTLGLPGLPGGILDLIVQYGPILVLADAVFGGFQDFSMFILMSNTSSTTLGFSPLSVFLSFGSSIIMGLAYIWLVQKRRIGWNTLAVALIIQILSQLVASGVSSILYSGVEVLITAYIMLQIRDSYSS